MPAINETMLRPTVWDEPLEPFWNRLMLLGKPKPTAPPIHPASNEYDWPTWWPYRYLDLAASATEHIDYEITPKTQRRYQLQFETLDGRLSHEFQKSPFGQNHVYSPAEYTVLELLWRGENVWETVDQINISIANGFKSDPHVAQKNIIALGLNIFLPAPFSNPILGELRALYQPERKVQSDEYYMQLCIALAYYGWETGEEPFGSLVVNKDGVIIGSAHNEIKMHNNDHTRHAEVIAIERAKGVNPDQTLENCSMFTTCAPCRLCTQIIRAHKGIKKIVCGTFSKMSDLAGLTDTFLDSRDSFEVQNDPFGKAPNVIVEVVCLDQIKNLYQQTGWYKMFPHLFKDLPIAVSQTTSQAAAAMV